MLYLGSSKLAVAQGSWLLWVVSNFSARLALTGIVTTIFVQTSRLKLFRSSQLPAMTIISCSQIFLALLIHPLERTATHKGMLRMSKGNCCSPAASL
ncbi:hypothetical protein B0H19DRAFT_1133437, partial [Mycena capillaripes]